MDTNRYAEVVLKHTEIKFIIKELTKLRKTDRNKEYDSVLRKLYQVAVNKRMILDNDLKSFFNANYLNNVSNKKESSVSAKAKDSMNNAQKYSNANKKRGKYGSTS